MRTAFLVVFCLGVTAAVDVCLPKTHTSWVSDVVFEKSKYPEDDCYEVEHAKYIVDGDLQMEVKMVYPHHHASHDIAMERWELRDFNKSLEYKAYIKNHTIDHCTVEDLDTQIQIQWCPGRNAKLIGGGTLGENYAVDFYNATYTHIHGFDVVVDLSTEAGSTSVPLTRHVVGTFEQDQDLFFSEHQTFWDISEEKPDPSVFDIPAQCPKI